MDVTETWAELPERALNIICIIIIKIPTHIHMETIYCIFALWEVIYGR